MTHVAASWADAKRSVVVALDIAPVLKLFPERGAAIASLAERDNEFLALCIDFGDAQAAMHKWQRSTDDIARERRLEFEALADDLAREIAVELDRVGVVSLADRRLKPG